MADIELDWRERPMMSPVGGFLTQIRSEPGNFEVIIPWPDGGLAHFFRDNAIGSGQWHGPTRFGDGDYTGATVIESDFRAFDRTLGNLEVLATRSNGIVDHFWRENGGHFLWKGPFRIFDGAGGSPSMAYSGAPFAGDSSAHGYSHFLVAAPVRGAGFSYWVRSNHEGDNIKWKDIGGAGSVTLSGVSLAVTTINHYHVSAGYKWVGIGGDNIVAGVSPHLGWLVLYVAFNGGNRWRDQTVFGRDVFPELDGEFVGQPCIMQGDFGYYDPSEWDPFPGPGHLGNLELVVPSRTGGVLHFWRGCGKPRFARKPIGQGWEGPTRIDGPVYDEVSLIQSDFSATEHGNLEMVARQRDQRGFDFYFRDEEFVWHGPHRISGARSLAQPLVSSPNPSVFGQAVTLTASVFETATPIRYVAFTDGTQELGRVPLTAGGASLTVETLPVGSIPISITYGGGAFSDATTRTVVHRVEPAGTTIDVMALGRRLIQDSATLSFKGDTAEAVLQAQAAVEVLRGFEPLAERKKDYVELFAYALHDLVSRFLQAGRHSEMEEPTEEAIRAYRQQSAISGAKVILVVDRLLSLSSTAATVWLLAAAVNSAQTAVEILRKFHPASNEQTTYTERMAEALYTLALRLQTAGLISEAVSPANEAVQVFRQLADTDPHRFGPILQKVEQFAASLIGN
ncbi:Ig-like domain-containing protein [Streptomyces coeruleorubidus]|uniref:Ig-like domain-containing protein n=1 Tax=Streptomyces coeruleorubidus TaxID=116188 RepID=UPI0033A7CE55